MTAPRMISAVLIVLAIASWRLFGQPTDPSIPIAQESSPAGVTPPPLDPAPATSPEVTGTPTVTEGQGTPAVVPESPALPAPATSPENTPTPTESKGPDNPAVVPEFPRNPVPATQPAGPAVQGYRPAASTPVSAGSPGGVRFQATTVSPLAAFVYGGDPKANAELVAIERDTLELSKQYREAAAANDQSRVDELRTKLEEALRRAFHMRQEQYTQHAKALRERLDKVESMIARRNKAEPGIVSARLEQLTTGENKLEWAPTLTPNAEIYYQNPGEPPQRIPYFVPPSVSASPNVPSVAPNLPYSFTYDPVRNAYVTAQRSPEERAVPQIAPDRQSAITLKELDIQEARLELEYAERALARARTQYESGQLPAHEVQQYAFSVQRAQAQLTYDAEVLALLKSDEPLRQRELELEAALKKAKLDLEQAEQDLALMRAQGKAATVPPSAIEDKEHAVRRAQLALRRAQLELEQHAAQSAQPK